MRALLPTGNLAEMVRLSDVAEPDPAANEVVVAVEAFSINRGETFLLENPQRGWRPGKDIVGRVVRAHALEDTRAVVQAVRGDVHVRVGTRAER